MNTIDNIHEIVNKIIMSEEGNIFDLFSELKTIEKKISEAIETVKPYIQNELDKYPEKIIYRNNMIFEKLHKSTYLYDECTEWRTLTSNLKRIENHMKRACINNEVVIDEETGEIFYPAQKKVTEYFTFKTK